MATFIKFLCVLFVLSFVGKGNCECNLSQVTIKQSKTGEVVQQKPVWSVTINNGCPCSQSDLKLSCNGFQTVKPVDHSVLSKSGNECLVNNGNCQCSLSSVSVAQSKSKLVVLTINLDGQCTLTGLVLSSNGFQTVLPLDPTVVVQRGNQLHVTAEGGTIGPFSKNTFAYAWDTSFSFKPIIGQPNCSGFV
ncbi:hypothetical protein CFP56_001735 [Quercus suber]|uniref:Uncharacterized protein n=1 Tax=Quercus suber TaxID=58331 RepID=A0AAW0ILR5_QUESU